MLKKIVEKIKCRFGCEHPVGIYYAPDGCICWPDKIQALCMQHTLKAHQNGVTLEPIILFGEDVTGAKKEV